MLKQRILTALIGLPIVMGSIYFGGIYLRLAFFSAFVAISVYEMASMLLPRLEMLTRPEEMGTVRINRFDLSLTVGLSLLLLWTFVFVDAKYTHGIVISCLLFSILCGTVLAKDNDTALGHALGYLMSIVYGALPWALIWDLAEQHEGLGYLSLLLVTVWAGDTGGYFGGRFWGRTPLAPRMSPKKTWEGALSGLALSAIGAVLTNHAYNGRLGSDLEMAVVGILVGGAGQIGDLVESTFKRFARIKDSGNIFPGHGGFLDRCDGLLFGAPMLWILQRLLTLTHS